VLRKLLFFPPLLLFAVAFFSLLGGNTFNFILWFFGGLILTFVFWPTALNMNDKIVPLLQLFIPLVMILLLSIIVFYKDLLEIGHLTAGESLGYGVLAGFGVIILIMFLKGAK
jgi:hypothetical protein